MWGGHQKTSKGQEEKVSQLACSLLVWEAPCKNARTRGRLGTAFDAHSARPVAPASGRAARFCCSSASSEEARLSSSSLPGLEAAGEPSSSRFASSTSSARRAGMQRMSE